MVNRNRKTVSTPIESADWTYCSLGSIKKSLDDAIAKYGESATLDWHSYAYDENKYLYIFAELPESDEAMERRIALEEQYEIARERRELAEYERLKKQFEK